MGSIAAVDCGTNSTRLLVVDGGGKPLARLMRITRLGQGVDASRVLAPEAVERTLRVLAEYRRVMDDLSVDRARMVATSAVRDAANGQEFLDAASVATGVKAELLSGEEEGRLSFRGATAGMGAVQGDVVVLDIGGGSTEVIAERHGRLEVISLDVGCVRLTERHLHHDPPTPGELDAAVATVGAALQQAVAALPILASLRPGSQLIGLAGTVSTLSMLDQGLARYERDRVHHSVLTIEAVERWCELLNGEPAAARGRRPGMVEGRQDVIVGGVLVLREVMRRLPLGTCLVSESDILDGLVLELGREGGS